MPATKTPTLHDAVCWLLPEEKCFLRLTLADGATWLIPLSVVVDDMTAYYAEMGWYDPCEIEEGAVEPEGDELRGLVYVNGDHESGCLEMHWRRAQANAVHSGGPPTEPPDDKLWAVEEQGGTIDLVTTMTIEQQRQVDYLLVCDVDPAQLEASHAGN